MGERPKLELDLNTPVDIQLLFDDPVIGESKYGNYFLYAVKTPDGEKSFFAPEQVHNELKNLKKGDKATVIKMAAQRNNKIVTSFAVELPHNGNGNGKHNSGKTAKDNDNPPNPPDAGQSSDNYYGVMLESYRDALKIQQELGGLVQPEKIAVTLFIARSKVNFAGV